MCLLFAPPHPLSLPHPHPFSASPLVFFLFFFSPSRTPSSFYALPPPPPSTPSTLPYLDPCFTADLVLRSHPRTFLSRPLPGTGGAVQHGQLSLFLLFFLFASSSYRVSHVPPARHSKTTANSSPSHPFSFSPLFHTACVLAALTPDRVITPPLSPPSFYLQILAVPVPSCSLLFFVLPRPVRLTSTCTPVGVSCVRRVFIPLPPRVFQLACPCISHTCPHTPFGSRGEEAGGVFTVVHREEEKK